MNTSNSLGNLLNASSKPTIKPLSQSTGSATGNPRNKCALKPGHSLMDWIRLGNSGVDLSGTGGRIQPVTKEELAKHNTRNDAWIAIRGSVYNVTRYLDFHPGGIEELMRGVGSDATKLFNEIHAWVNYSQLLNKCCIGPLMNPVNLQNVSKESFPLTNNETVVQPFAKPLGPAQEADIVPRLDWIQKSDDITLYFYTKQFSNPGFMVRNLYQEDNRVEICIFIAVYVYKFDFELQGRINWPPKEAQVSTESGKIAVKFHKQNDELKLWNNLGKHKRTKVLASTLDLETSSLKYTVSTKTQFNNNSFVMLLKNENVIYTLPVGYHLTIKGFVNNIDIDKSYTPVPKKYIEKFVNNETDFECLNFLIKQYPHPKSFTQYLCNLENNTTLEVSLPKGNFKLSTLASHRKLCFLAAGSGLTPFLALIDHLLKRNTNRIEVLKLFYFNKSSTDIWCNEILTNTASEDERFEFINVLSNAEESWTGIKGRVSSELLFPIVRKSMETVTHICMCGPNGFVVNVEEILKELNFPNENIFTF